MKNKNIYSSSSMKNKFITGHLVICNLLQKNPKNFSQQWMDALLTFADFDIDWVKLLSLLHYKTSFWIAPHSSDSGTTWSRLLRPD